MSHRFYIVDVFTEKPYSGNPLAVILDADDLSIDTMQKLAAEMNFSETTFVMSAPEPNGGYRVRIFTPAREIEFAGHPLLGTAWVIRQHVAPNVSGSIDLNLNLGQVPVTFESSAEGKEVAWFLAPPMSLGPTCPPKQVAEALGVSPEDIATQTPVQQVSAGTSAILVPLHSLEALRRSRLDLEAFAPLAGQGFPPLVYLFCPETHHPQNNLCVRFFFDAHGVREDPATGNGAAFLGIYLLAHNVDPGSVLFLRIEQGYEMRRPSLVLLRAHKMDTSQEVWVGGSIIPIIEGKLL
jgi:trans-2,3-dihydro-3-hydroxyanthranilate isomerase